jgi:hypothetical protein
MTAKERRQKKKAERKGLLWSDDPAVREAATEAAFRAMVEERRLTSEDVQTLWDTFKDDGLWDALRLQVSNIWEDQNDADEAFRNAWNAVIRASREIQEQVEEAITPAAPRKQVSMDKAAELPQAVKDRLAKQQEKPEVPAWLIPAIGLALVVFLWRK